MCGIVGAYGPPGSQNAWLERAVACLRHRGPDDRGLMRDHAAGFGMGQTRLAIQDVSSAGHQPMMSACGRYHLIFNGEIYNHAELRAMLAPRAWRGHADSETLLACLAEWGVEATLRAAVGMFALALFDSEERKLVLARDRFGEKPLYYGYAGNAFVFGSELKGLLPAERFDPTLDREALAAFMRLGYVPAPRSIYAAIRKLSPGCYLELTPRLVGERADPTAMPYWSALSVARAGVGNRLTIGEREATDQLEELLGRSIRGQMLSDVPLGAFLSGGIDSSTIVALMQKQSARPVRTFSIGFEDSDYDESEHARAVAAHLRTDHTELKLRAADALALIPQLPSVYDEPFADPSQLPTMLVARLARQHVTVALSGDAGDELFAGYNRYLLAARAWGVLGRVPPVLRRAAAHALRAVPPRRWNSWAAALGRVSRRRMRLRMAGDRMHKFAGVLQARSDHELYQRLVNQWWQDPIVPGETAESPAPHWTTQGLDLTERMMLTDTLGYLADDILVKVDRAAMSVSLETRVPFLDHRVFEFAWRLPADMKVRAGRGKWLLRQVLYRHVPPALIERPKMGFGVPLDSWLRGPLCEWAGDLINDPRMQADGFLNADLVRRKWQEHLSGVRNWQYQLWNVLVFRAWLDGQKCVR
jgi:asparagine synthase (glutamine-hydrolysing)